MLTLNLFFQSLSFASVLRVLTTEIVVLTCVQRMWPQSPQSPQSRGKTVPRFSARLSRYPEVIGAGDQNWLIYQSFSNLPFGFLLICGLTHMSGCRYTQLRLGFPSVAIVYIGSRRFITCNTFGLNTFNATPRLLSWLVFQDSPYQKYNNSVYIWCGLPQTIRSVVLNTDQMTRWTLDTSAVLKLPL